MKKYCLILLAFLLYACGEKSQDRVLKANPDCDIYSTNMAEVNIPILGDRLEYFKDTYGSVVVRVAADGNSYMVYVLDDTDSSYRIKTINGPYRCVN